MTSYDHQPGFHIDAAASAAYTTDLEEVIGSLSSDETVLEVGAGTGVFTQFLTSAGLTVLGIDKHETALEVAQERLPQVAFKAGDLESPDFASSLEQRFDLLISRYVIHELRDPIATFSSWASLLKPGGKMVMIENAWIRSDWGISEWGQRSNELPLACTQTWATAVYCLTKAGFSVREARWMEAVNGLEEIQRMKQFHLYIIVAEWPG